MNAIRFTLRALIGAVLALLALLALFLVAWLPFNLSDDAPKVRPAALVMPPARVSDEGNAAYVVVGLLAESGRDAATAGRAVWAAQRAWAALPAERRAAESAAREAQVSAALGKGMAAPKGAPLICDDGKRNNCDAEWLAAPDALAAQRAAYGAIGERCDRLVDGAPAFEELLPPGAGVDAPLMPWGGVVECSRWFRSGAMVALARGKRDEALAQLRRADRLYRMLWDGARTLVGHMVATRVARQSYETMAAAVLREPALADAMAPWVAGPLDTRTGARRWMLVEAHFQQGLVDDLAGAAAAALVMSESPLGLLASGPGAALAQRLNAHGIGFHRERTRQRLDQLWQRKLATLQYAWPAVLAGAAVETQTLKQRSAWGSLHWRNTFGEALIEAVADTPYGPYYARHADHELHREAASLVLALQRQRVVAAQRAEAARKMPGLGDVLKERMTWSADGRTLTVNTWLGQTPSAVVDPRRDGIVFNWPQ
jgi:hypothetical protein